MINAAQKTTTYDWLRAYTALSRSGHVTEAISACEAEWGATFHGEPSAIEAIRKLPEYAGYAQALRGALRFPLTLYRVTTVELYEKWRSGTYSHRPVATSLSLEFTRLVREVYPIQQAPLVLITGALLNPEAVIMRGRVERYELVVDSGGVNPLEVRVLER
jgi:hypothetical protein